MAEILVDSYSEENQNDEWYLYEEEEGAGQSFTAIAGNLSSCKFYLKKSGSPMGNIVAKLYAHSGTYGVDGMPTGDPLAISDTIDISTLTTSFQLITFTFTGDNKYALVNETYYVIVVEYSGGYYGNCLLAGIDNSSPTHSGNMSQYCYGCWYGFADFDLCFYVYCEEAEIVKTFSESGSGSEILLADKVLLFIETGSGVDVFIIGNNIVVFSDTGEGIENLLVDKILLLEDSGSGAESWIADKLREFVDSGVGIDVFLRDWTPIFTDLGSGLEAYYKVFHYPPNLKRIIILIRDKK